MNHDRPSPLSIREGLNLAGVRITHEQWCAAMEHAHAADKRSERPPLPEYTGNDPLEGVMHNIRAMRAALGGNTA